MQTIGVLSLQGCVDQHLEIIKLLGANAIRVVDEIGLQKADKLIIPGGESSTMLKLIHALDLLEPLKNFLENKPTWGVCAGSILLASEVVNPVQESLNAIKIRATRNFYGAQQNSFKAKIFSLGTDSTFDADFIRAPLLTPLSETVEILGTYKDSDKIIPVWFKEKHIVASACHTELTDLNIKSNLIAHEYFFSL